MAATRGLITDPLRNFKFLVNISHPLIDGSDMGPIGFSSVSGISAQTQPITYREGGDNTTTRKMPGQTDFPPLMFRRGMIPTNSYKDWYWFKEIFFATAGQGYNTGGVDFRADIIVNILDHPVNRGPVIPPIPGTVPGAVLGTSRAAFKFFNCWISQISFSDLEAGGNGIMVQQMEILHEGFDIKIPAITNAGPPYLPTNPYQG